MPCNNAYVPYIRLTIKDERCIRQSVEEGQMLKHAIKTLGGPVVLRECRRKTCWCFERLSSFDHVTYYAYEDYLKCKEKDEQQNSKAEKKVNK